jgi:hypothetical protein
MNLSSEKQMRVTLLIFMISSAAFLGTKLLSAQQPSNHSKGVATLGRANSEDSRRAREELKKLVALRRAMIQRPPLTPILQAQAQEPVTVINALTDKKKEQILEQFHATLKLLHQEDAAFNAWVGETLASGTLYRNAQFKILSEIQEQIEQTQSKVITLSEWIEATKSRLVMGIRTHAPESLIEEDSRQVQQWEASRLNQLTLIARLQGLAAQVETQTTFGLSQFNEALRIRRAQEVSRREEQSQYLDRLNYGLETFDSRQEALWKMRQPFVQETYFEQATLAVRPSLAAVLSRPARRPASVQRLSGPEFTLTSHFPKLSRTLAAIQETDEILDSLRKKLIEAGVQNQAPKAGAPSNL